MVNIWSLFDHISGSRCVLCGSKAAGLCRRCVTALPANGHRCACCAVPLPAAADPLRLCPTCQRARPSYDQAIAPLLYRPPVDHLITELKFHQRLALLDSLVLRLVDEVLATRTDTQALPDVLVPVPMHAQRLRERGFNHASELAREIGQRLEIPVDHRLVQRVRPTRPQMKLSRRARRTNLGRAFTSRAITNRCVAVVDDVMTTGATAEEVARVLRAQGARTVECWSVARTPPRGQEY